MSKSRKVPPPTEVTVAIMRIPKMSIRFLVAVITPEIANEIVPKISIISAARLSITVVYNNYNLLIPDL